MKNVKFPASQCSFRPGSKNIIALRYEEVVIVDEEGKAARTIRRRQMEIGWINPKGSLLRRTARPRSCRRTANQHHLTSKRPNGDPIRVVSLPSFVGRYPRIAYDGRRVLVAGDSGLLLVDASDASLQRFCPPQMTEPKEQQYWYPYLVAGGRELLLFDGQSFAMHRYAMP